MVEDAPSRHVTLSWKNIEVHSEDPYILLRVQSQHKSADLVYVWALLLQKHIEDRFPPFCLREFEVASVFDRFVSFF
jgi:hypothetical protein